MNLFCQNVNTILLLIILFLNGFHSDLLFPPDQTIEVDDLWDEDHPNTSQSKIYLVYAIVCSKNNYNDERNGILYIADEPNDKMISGCSSYYSNNTNQLSIINGQTKNPRLYQYTCDSNNEINLNLHFYFCSETITYRLTFKVFNESVNPVQYTIIIKNLSGPDLKIDTVNVPGKTRHLYYFDFRIILRAYRILLVHCDLIRREGISYKNQGGDWKSRDGVYFSNCQANTMTITLKSKQGTIKLAAFTMTATNVKGNDYTGNCPRYNSVFCDIPPHYCAAGGDCNEKKLVCKENTGCYNRILFNKDCEKCDKACASCNGKDVAQCTKCFSNSISYDEPEPKNVGLCIFDFFDAMRMINMTVSVPPSIHWRVTMEFWLFINNPQALIKGLYLIYYDFLTIAIEGGSADHHIDVSCIPFEWVYPVHRNSNIKVDNYMSNANGFYMSESISVSRPEWKYIRCAFDVDNHKAYLNDIGEYELKIPQSFSKDNNLQWYQKKYYSTTQKVLFEIKKTKELQKVFAYIRNINVYREYISQKVQTKYFNMHKATKEQAPQLLFSIPLDDVQSKGDTDIYFFSYYDYSLRESNEIIKHDLEGTFEVYENESLVPPRNFKRLKFLSPNNYQYKFIDLHGKPDEANDVFFIKIDCINQDAMCFDNNKVYCCSIKDDLLYYNPFYTNDNDQCLKYCPDGIMRHPYDNAIHNNAYCSFRCDASFSVCPYHSWDYFDPNTFRCQSGYINHYYKCEKEDSEKMETSLHFGEKLQSHKVKLKLNTPMNSFAIDVWILLDKRFPDELDENGNRVEKTIFQTDHVRITNINTYYVDSNLYRTQDDINENTWNHMILTNDYSGNSTSFSVTFRQNGFIESDKIENSFPLERIFFCKEEGCNNWRDSYYKKLKIWDLTYTNALSVIYSSQYEDLDLISFKIYLRMDLSHIINNQIVDVKSNAVTTTIEFQKNNQGQNKNNNNVFNYQINPAYEDIHYHSVITKAVSKDDGKYIDIINTGKCHDKCKQCYEADKDDACYSCYEPYGLISNRCEGKEDNYYYFRNPGTHQPDEISLSISKYNFAQYKAITVLFFIKIYSFLDNASELLNKQSQKLITFDKTSNFHLRFIRKNESEDGRIELIYGSYEEIQFQRQVYRSNLFGKWIPISIAAFKEYDTTISRSIIQMTVNYENLPYLIPKNTIHTFLFQNFIIHKQWVGLLSDVTFYKGFIVNAFGFRKHHDQSDLLLVTFPLKSQYQSTCIQDSQLNSDTAVNLGIVCAADFNPYMNFTECANDTAEAANNPDYDKNSGFIVESNQKANCDVDSTHIFNIRGVPTCDYRDQHFYSYLFTLKEDAIVCFKNERVDLARFNTGTIKNIVNVQTAFSIDFWFYTRSYYHNNEKINFDSFTLSWNNHMKIKIQSNITEQAGVINNNLLVQCYPVINELYPNKDPTPQSFIEDAMKGWIYINCGVNYPDRIMYITNTNANGISHQFTTENTIPILGTSILSFKETSINSYGVTFMAELRLWSCYDCSASFRNLAFDPLDPKFISVIHAYGGGLPNGELKDAKNGIDGQLVERTNFIGYNILEEIENPIVCDEKEFEYYNVATNQCDRLINLPRIGKKAFKVTSSRTQRYTMDLWIFVEIPSSFTNGINFIWDKHLGISVIRESSSLTSITALCLPQGYYDDLSNKKSSDIFTVYNNALNKDQVLFPNANEQWLYVRCSVDLSRDIFYINKNTPKSIIPETFYGTTRNDKSYRYFDIEEQTEFRIENSEYSDSRVFLRFISLYREYIPNNLFDMRFIDIKDYFTKAFWPIVFHMDFNEYQKKENTDEISYYAYFDYIPEKRFEYPSFTDPHTDKYYPTYPNYYNVSLCPIGTMHTNTNDCVEITKASCKNDFCLNENQYFYYSGKYLDENLLPVDKCNDSIKLSRLPDTKPNEGYCLLIEDFEKVNSVPTNEANFYGQFSCGSNYERAYYKCLHNTKVDKSALYFNSFYGFSPLEIDLSAMNIQSHYFEFWMKFDNINTKTNSRIQSSSQLYYLYADPHIIKKNLKENAYYYYYMSYANPLLPVEVKGNKLNSISTYEWNRIIIHTVISDTDDTLIQLYLNYEFTNPEFVLNVPVDEIRKIRNIKFTTKIAWNNEDMFWGNAWYSNMRIWKEDITSLELIMLYGTSQSDLIKYIKTIQLHYSFDISSINKDEVSEQLNQVNNLNSFFWHGKKKYDYSNLENFSTNQFDFSFVNPGKYVSGVSNDKINVITGNCAIGCSKCYSSGATDCYECLSGFILYEKQCKTLTGYYLKTGDSDIDIKITVTNPITMMFWMKYIGVDNTYPDNGSDILPMVTFSSNFELVLDNKDNEIQFICLTDKCYSISIQGIIAKWIHIGISVYVHDDSITLAFPDMLNIMINKEILIPLESLTPYKRNGIKIDQFVLHSNVVCLYSFLQLYDNYWIGSFGHVTSAASSAIDQYMTVPLKGSSTTNCLNADQLNNNPTFICVDDYNPYEDNKLNCKNDDKIINLSLFISPPCENCNSNCLTQCYDSNENQCSSNFREGLYWIKTQSTNVNSYVSERITNINFGLYENITIDDIQSSTNDEMSLEFWVYIYQYLDSTFESITVDWENQVRMDLYKNNANQYTMKCTSNQTIIPTPPSSVVPSITSDLNYKQWYYVRCACDYLSKKLFLFKREKDNKYPIDLSVNTNGELSQKTKTKLKISQNISKSNYGFVFIRELKLLSTSLFTYWDPSMVHITVDNFPFILHYFSNIFNGTDISKVNLYDEISLVSTPLTLRNDNIGYNYVVDYEDTVVCLEGSVYDLTTKQCKLESTTGCIYPMNNYNSICLLCESSFPYLTQAKGCTDNCPARSYNDDYLKQCRECDNTCLTCFGRYNYTCLSCESPRYLYEKNHTCILDCGLVNMVNSTNPTRICTGFDAQSQIVDPSDISIPINPNTFRSITAEIFYSTEPNYTAHWEFDPTETEAINADNKNGALVLDHYINPIVGQFNTSSDFKATFDPSYEFKTGYKYVFNLKIEKGSVKLTHPYIFTMNGFPEMDIIELIPEQGYTTYTKFVFRCEQCTDDNTESEDLLYQISYYDPDINVNPPGSTITETIIKGYSNEREILFFFDTLPNGGSGSDFSISCTCKDSIGATVTVTKNVTLYDFRADPTVFLIKDLLEPLKVNNQLIKEETLRRILVYESITENHNKDIINTITDRTAFYPSSKTISSSSNMAYLDMVDPTKDNTYCNNNGEVYLIDKFLVCLCNEQYIGVYCHIDKISYNNTMTVLQSLYKRILYYQENNVDQQVLDGIYRLIKSSVYYAQDSSFIIQIIDYIKSSMITIPIDEFCAQKEYMDMLHLLYDWGVNQMNYKKAINYTETYTISQNDDAFTIMRNMTLNETQTNEMGNYFILLKKTIEDLSLYYKDSIPQLNKAYSFSYKNFDISINTITETFSYISYFSNGMSNYNSYIDITDCLTSTMMQSFQTKKYTLLFVYINWKVSPYYYSTKVSQNSTSYLEGIQLFDKETLKEIKPRNCDKDNRIKIYFPIDNYTMPSRINEKRNLVSPDQQYKKNHPIFTEPVYIEKSGRVSDETLELRRDKYFVNFNFSCRYYKESNISFDTNGCDYTAYTDNNYVVCSCSHLTDFGVFVDEINSTFLLDSRFFYLKHYMLTLYGGNYILSNYALYIFAILLLAYIIIILFWVIFDQINFSKMDLLDFLIDSLYKVNQRYKDNIAYKPGFKLDPGVENRLRIEKMDTEGLQQTEIKDLDVMILTDNIEKYKGNHSVDGFYEKRKQFYTKDNEETKGLNSRNKSSFFEGSSLNNSNKDDKNNSLSKINALLGMKDIDNKDKQIKAPKFFNQENINKIEEVDEDFMNTEAVKGNIKTQNNNFIGLGNPPKRKKSTQDTIGDSDKNIISISYRKSNNTSKTTEKRDSISSSINYSSERDLNQEKPKEVSKEPTMVIKTERQNIDLPKKKFTFQKVELPNLPYMTQEIRLFEFSRLNLTTSNFLFKNITKRHFYFSTLIRSSLFYGRYKRVGNLIASLSLFGLTLSLLLTYDEDVIINEYKGIQYLVGYTIVAICVSSTIIQFLSLLFYVNDIEMRRLYNIAKVNQGITILKEYEDLQSKYIWRSVLGVFLQLIIFVASFYVSFCFCATYKYQRMTFLIGFLGGIVFDCFFFEFIYEVILACLYSQRKKGGWMLSLAERLNRWRYIKVLI